ncbi:hypothetical protein X777_07223 [Ooceraea biroi]|uniref:Uncharacterized protein n=1 Tax=Ooceraea biroi TaxID=2015173 RepID=A0A026WAF9_OOCBI|nr:hypothetical protein X777_07223 [Ooceraea biroi]
MNTYACEPQRRHKESSNSKKRETILYLVAFRQSRSNTSPGSKPASPRSSLWLLSRWPSGDRFLPAKRPPKFRKSEPQGLLACVGSEKGSLFRCS